MSGASDIKAGEAYVVISAKLDDLKADLAKANQQIAGFGKSFSGAGAILAGPFGIAAASATAVIGTVGAAAYQAATQAIAFGKAFADAGSQINDMSVRTGLSASQLQAMKYAAEQTGASLNDVETAAKMLVKNGFKVGDFERIGQEIAAIQDPTERTAAALETFGKAGTRVIPLFAEWSKLKAASAAAGPVLTQDEVGRADALGDAFSALKASMERITQQVGSALSPALQQVLETSTGIAATFGDIASIIKTAAQSSAVLRTAGMVLSAPLKSFQDRGHAAVVGTPKLAPMDGDMFESKSSKEVAQEQQRRALEMAKQITEQFRQRQALVEAMLTPHERFLQKEQEIIAAIKQARAQGDAGVFNLGAANRQVTDLNVALQRLRQQEQERLAAQNPRLAGLKPEAVAMARIQSSSAGTFSGAAAGLLGRSGDPILRENKEQTTLMRRIEKNTRTIGGGPTFS